MVSSPGQLLPLLSIEVVFTCFNDFVRSIMHVEMYVRFFIYYKMRQTPVLCDLLQQVELEIP